MTLRSNAWTAFAFWSTAGGRAKGFSRKSTEGISNNHRCLAKRHFPACRQAGANRRVNACLSADRAEAKIPHKAGLRSPASRYAPLWKRSNILCN